MTPETQKWARREFNCDAGTKAGKNVATKIAKESLRALVRTSVDGRRQSRRRRLLHGATREVNHRRSTERGRRSRCGRHWCCSGYSTDMNCRRYYWSESCRRHGRRGTAQVIAKTKLVRTGIANMFAVLDNKIRKTEDVQVDGLCAKFNPTAL